MNKLTDKIFGISKSLDKVKKNNSKRPLNLPTVQYGPFCMKILHEFITHHKLPTELLYALPDKGQPVVLALSRIFDVMLHSMGSDKRESILNELDAYNLSVSESRLD